MKWIRSRRVVRSFRKFSKIKKLERIVCFFHFQNNVPKITYFAYFRFPRSLRIPHRHVETASLGKELQPGKFVFYFTFLSRSQLNHKLPLTLWYPF